MSSLLLALSLGCAWAGLAPKEMTRFNQRCPAPRACESLIRSSKACKATGEEKDCKPFVDVMRELAPAYDCQRPFDKGPVENYVVPAVWLCEDAARWDALKLLSGLRLPEARRFFSSRPFRDTLDGESAELYYGKSKALEKKLRR